MRCINTSKFALPCLPSRQLLGQDFILSSSRNGTMILGHLFHLGGQTNKIENLRKNRQMMGLEFTHIGICLLKISQTDAFDRPFTSLSGQPVIPGKRTIIRGIPPSTVKSDKLPRPTQKSP